MYNFFIKKPRTSTDSQDIFALARECFARKYDKFLISLTTIIFPRASKPEYNGLLQKAPTLEVVAMRQSRR